MMCWKCPLNHWDASLGMFLFNLIYLNFSDILEVFCTKPSITIPNTLMNAKINPNPLSVDLHNFRDFFMSIGWAQVIGWVWSLIGAGSSLTQTGGNFDGGLSWNNQPIKMYQKNGSIEWFLD